MKLKRPFHSGDNVSFKGEDIKQNQVLVQKGVAINPCCGLISDVWIQ